MRKTVILSFLFFAAILCAQGIKFEKDNFKNILAKAKKENKLIFLDAYTDWCAPCKLMAKKIFPLKTVGDYYNSRFINAKIDMEKGEGKYLAKKYYIVKYPTYLFISGDGKVVHRTDGYVEEKDFIQFAADAEKKNSEGESNSKFINMKKKFESGEKDPEFLLNLADLAISEDRELYQKVLERYFSAKTTLSTLDIFKLFGAVRDVDSPLLNKLFQDNKEAIAKILTPEGYEMIDEQIRVRDILKTAYERNTKKLNEKSFLMEAQKFYPADKSERLLKKVKAKFALDNNDKTTYEKITLDLYKDYTNASSSEIESAAMEFLKNVDTKSSLETAIKWAQEAVKRNENPVMTEVLAKLHKKIGDVKNAKIWEQKTIELSEALDNNTGE